MPKTIYVCEKCGAPFDVWSECDQHEEKDHASINFYGDFEAIHTSDAQFYPESILVPFRDGSIMKYCFAQRVREADPDPKESPLDSEESEED